MLNVKVWDIFEMPLTADIGGITNPLTQISLKAIVTGPIGEQTIEGFYDGGNVFLLRYMPSEEGMYHLKTRSNIAYF